MLFLALTWCWTAKADVSLPYSYGFEDNNLATDGWTDEISSSSSGIYNAGSSSAHGGSYVFRFYYSENPAYLVSPVLDGTDKGVAVSFYYKNYSTSYVEEFQVGYTTDETATDPSSFTYGATVYGENTWALYENIFPAGTKKIAIKYIYTNALYLYIDDFSFSIPASCPKPSDLAASNVTDNSASINWTENSEATAWQICVNNDEDNLIDVSENPYTLSGLDASTPYTVKVRANCGSEYSEWSSVVNFSTTAVATPVGNSWSDNFEGTTCDWDFINGTLTNAWAWGTAANNGGTHALYISNDGGTTNAYTNNSAVMVYAVKLLNFADGKYEFAYDWRANGESTYDYLRVALVPASVELAAGTSTPSGFSTTALPTGWIALDGGSKLNLVTAWQSKSVAINVTSGNYYLVLAWRDDTSGGDTPPAAVDNVSIVKMACPYDVAGLAVVDGSITTSSATLTWTAGEASQWQIAYGTASNFEGATEEIVGTATINLTGLQSSSVYYARVRAYCGGTDFGAWSDVISFPTECEAIDLNLSANDTLWFEKFDSYTAAAGFLPICWNRINTCSYSYYDASNYPRVYANGSYSTYAHSAPNCLYLYSYYYNSSSYDYDPQPQYAILPEMENLAGKQITLWAKGYNTSSTFKIGVMSDPADANTFTLIKEQALTTSYQEFAYIIPANATASYVAIMIDAADDARSTNGVYIDDILIAYPPACPKPTDLEATPSSQTATLTWNSEASGFDIAYSTDATANPDENVVGNSSTNTYSKSNLALDTDHYFWVRANCGTDSYSEWVGPISVHIGYCVPGPTSRDGKGITGVVFGQGDDVVNNSDANGLPNASPYYGDYKGQIGAVQAGVESTIAITTSTGSYPYTFVIWVDFDNDLTFEDDEIIYTGKCASGAGPLNANITIPASQALGDYRMRIAGADSYFNSFYNNGGALDYTKDHDPCLTGSIYAVFHDYTLRVLEAPSCLKPTSLSVVDNSITANGVTISWDGTSDSYNVQYRTASHPGQVYLDEGFEGGAMPSEWSATSTYWAVGSGTGSSSYSGAATGNYNATCYINVGSSTSDILITPAMDLSAASAAKLSFNYRNVAWSSDIDELHVYYRVNEGDWQPLYENLAAQSAWTTTPITIELTGLAANYQIGFKCTTGSGSYSYGYGMGIDDVLVYEMEDAGQWQSVSSTETSKQLVGLTPETKYDVQVQGVCGGSTSDMSEVISFTTLPSCLPVSGLAVKNITASSADFTWADNSGQTQWQYACVLENASPVWSTENIVDAPSASVSGLNANTSYDFYVRAYCSATDQSDSIMLNFRTECEAIAITFDAPYGEDFEDPIVTTTYSQAGQIPDCWEGYPATNAGPKILAAGKSYNYASSGQVLYFYGSGNNYAVLPKISNPLSDLQISFKWATESSSNGTLTLGYITDEDVDYNTFKVIKAFPASSASYHQLVQENIFLDTLPASASKLVFRWYYSGQYGCNVDDIIIRLANIVDINASEYATYFNSEKAYIMPAGVTGHAFANGALSDAVYQSADVVPAAIPLVLHGPAGSYLLASSSEAGAPLSVANDLIGVNIETEIEDESGYLFYVLSLNAANDVDSVGFYWMNATGAGGFTLPAHKAYLKYGASSAPAAFYLFNGENNATWLDNLEGVEGTVKFLHEGNIYILRDGIIYDATGRKVRELK